MYEEAFSQDVSDEFLIQGIYCIKHSPTNRIYVGSSVNIKYRLRQHWNMLVADAHHSQFLQNAWNKYGYLEFEACVLEIVEDFDVLIDREQYWIDFFDSYKQGFNARPNASSVAGIKWTKAQNDARRRSNIKAWSNLKLRQKLSEKFKGKRRGVWTEESHKKVSASLRKAHNEKPEWRSVLKAALEDPSVQKKRVAGIRKSLENPKIYKARISQLQEASGNPKNLSFV